MEETSVGGRFAPFNGGPPNPTRYHIGAHRKHLEYVNEGKITIYMTRHSMRDTSHRFSHVTPPPTGPPT